MEENNQKKKLNILTIVALVLTVSGIILISVYEGDLKPFLTVNVITIIIGLISFILSIIALNQKNKKGKVLTIINMVLSVGLIILCGIMCAMLMLFQDITINDELYCTDPSYVIDCVDNHDGTSTCQIEGFDGIDMPCSTDKLVEEQFKK